MGELRTDKRLVLNKSETVIIHVRAHAKKAIYRFDEGEEYGNVERAANTLPNGEDMTTQNFWVNNSYILGQIKDIVEK